FKGLILCHRVGGNEPLLFHDATNAAPGDDKPSLAELHFDLACAVGFSILEKDIYNSSSDIVLSIPFLGVVIECTSCDLQDVAHRCYPVFITVILDDSYCRPTISAACFKMSFSTLRH